MDDVYEIISTYKWLNSAHIRGYKALVGCIVKLEIPPDAKIHEGYFKYRASKAIVKGYFDPFNYSRIETPENDMYRRSTWDTRFIYPNSGEEVIPDSYDDSDYDCSHGIHFFRTMKDAVIYWRYMIQPKMPEILYRIAMDNKSEVKSDG